MSEEADRDIRLPLIYPWLLVVMIFGFAHLALAPRLGFVLDDWTNYFISNAHATWAESMQVALRGHVTRPVTMVWTYSVYRVLGENFTAYLWLSFAAHALNLGLFMMIVRRLSGEKRTALLAGLIFALLPVISENINWCTMIISAAACAIPLFLASALCWILFVQKQSVGWGVGSAIFYALGVFGYEIGALLPLAFGVLLLKSRLPFKKLVAVGAAFVLLGGFYAGWRLTSGFGLIEANTLGSQFEVEATADMDELVITNVKNVAHWWTGDYFYGAVLSGLEGFGNFGMWPRRIVLLSNILIGVLLGRVLLKNFRGRERSEKSVFVLPAFWFAVVWIIGGHGPSIVSYTASRLNYLPAMGVALLLALVLRRWDVRLWVSGLVVLVVMLLTANQGMNKNWSDASELNRRVYAHLEQHKGEWQGKAVVFYDTTGLAERQARGLLSEPSFDLSTVAFNGRPEQAGLFRGFGLFGMHELLKEGRDAPQAVLDVECHPRIEGDRFFYHNPHRPKEPREQPMSEVFVVDVGSLLGE